MQCPIAYRNRIHILNHRCMCFLHLLQKRSVSGARNDGSAAGSRKKGNKGSSGGQAEWTGSMRKFMALKAAMNAPDAKQQRSGHATERQGEAAQRSDAPAPGAGTATGRGGDTGSTGTGRVTGVDVGGRVQPDAGTAARSGKQAPGTTQPPSGVFREKTLKARKKAFLKAKEQRKKGGRGGAVEAEELLETKRAISAPRFGEQAEAPLKAHLKRKHWVAEHEPERALAPRHAGLALAKKLQPGLDRQEADKLQYDAIAGYRDLKAARLAARGVEFNAYQTPASLATIARANEN